MGRYNDLIDRLDGYTVGTLIVDDGVVLLQSGVRYLTLTDAKSIEVLNAVDGAEHYVALTLAECLTESTDGWPLFAGLYARVRF
ncbi:hypothetical protein [Cytobacillus massiliigabonensis]|uniref:hypothetical protein n=1 Tax=Cytobacillus massiliigabonensis TaxID=1871011 RepID=UPI000C81C166|nr:hypothetical protein [Cytobacillus massiliigabonensis]